MSRRINEKPEARGTCEGPLPKASLAKCTTRSGFQVAFEVHSALFGVEGDVAFQLPRGERSGRRIAPAVVVKEPLFGILRESDGGVTGNLGALDAVNVEHQ